MIKHFIKVKEAIKYISQWREYRLPKGEHCIVDKGVTGCGYTEFCLTNEDPVVLCSPRKLLLENKRDQHVHDHNILYLENKMEKDKQDYEAVKAMKKEVEKHLFVCQELGLSPKFMITYDSTPYIIQYLIELGLLDQFTFVVDEFQSIFLDSYFKSNVEINFVESLQACESVVYLSATPMLDKYLERLPEFKDLTCYKLDWSDTGYVERIKIKRRRVASLITECGNIIDKYLAGDFPMALNSENQVVESKEAVFYFNSVSEITRIIKAKGLTPKNTLILCSPTTKNEAKLDKIKFTFGRVPLKDEPNPMFIFCTSAIYMGVDFYSDCATSYVFADPNVDCLALDISLDLAQISGRQRNRLNPFKNEIVLFYRTKRKNEKKVTKEEFDEAQKSRREETERLLEIFDGISDVKKKESFLRKLKESIELSRYSKDFISISKNSNLPVYNYLIDIANERAWEVSQDHYQDEISVTTELLRNKFDVEGYKSKEEILVEDFLTNKFYTTGIFREKMRMYCEFRDQYGENKEILEHLFFRIKDQKFRMFYEYYGTKGCSARSYQEGELEKGWKNATLEDRLKMEMSSRFKPGDRYSLEDFKVMVQEVYDGLGLKKKAKAKDLEQYFKLSKIFVPGIDKKTGEQKMKHGYKIVGAL